MYLEPNIYLDMTKCPEGRFDGYTQFTDAVKLTENYYCLVNQNLELLGSLDS